MIERSKSNPCRGSRLHAGQTLPVRCIVRRPVQSPQRFHRLFGDQPFTIRQSGKIQLASVLELGAILQNLPGWRATPVLHVLSSAFATLGCRL